AFDDYTCGGDAGARPPVGEPPSGYPPRPPGGYPGGGTGQPPGGGYPAAPSRPGVPPQLDATVRFEDEGADGVLDGDERAEVRVTVRNRGRGTAYALSLVLATPDARGVEFGGGERLDSLAPGQTATLRVRLAAPSTLREGRLIIDVRLREGNGFDLDPAPRLEVTTRGFRPPRFALEGVVVNDQSGDGRIAPREIVELRVRVANRGAGEARDVRASLRLAPDVFLTPESPTAVAFGLMRPGDVRDVVLSAFTNSRAKGFGVAVVLREARTRFDTVLALPLALDKPIASNQVIVERTRPADAAVPPPLVVDVDTGIPRARAANPRAVAVVLGVERYERLPGVSFAARDAAIFREYAVRTFGVRDDPEHLYYGLDADVTGTALRKVFGAEGWLGRRVTPETDVIVYWAGHGGPDLKTRAPYLLPADADANYPLQTGYSLHELYERLAALNARSVTVFLDACFSGWTRDAGQLLAGARDVGVSLENPVLTNDRMSVFAASAGNQVSSAWPAMRHGLFTYFLLKGLRGAAESDGAPGVTVGELDAYLRREVPPQAGRLDREQRPQLTSVKTDRILVVP
ncbi:MAG: caspase family protein, partial [Gemmatimonadota bacterium]|nr:caspase family protein [Gemmatimonadota bacterium]